MANSQDALAALLSSSEQQYGIPAGLLSKVLQAESGGNNNAVSSAGAIGPMQFMPKTAKEFGVTNPRDPRQAIPAAAKKLSGELKANHGNVPQALAAWNRGEGNVARNPQNPAVTNKFISNVMGGQQQQNFQGTVDNSPYLKQMQQAHQERMENQQNREQTEGAILQQLQQETQNLPHSDPIDLPQWKPTAPAVNNADFKVLSSTLLGLGLIFGARGGKSGFLAATESMAGALQGYLDGNIDLAKQKHQEYEDNYKRAMDTATQSQAKVKELLEEKQLNQNMLLAQLKVIGEQYNRQDMIYASEQSDAIQAMRSYDSVQMSMVKAQDMHDYHAAQLTERQLDRAQRAQIDHNRLSQIKDIPATAMGKINANVQATKDLKSLVNQAKADPGLLNCTFALWPGWETPEKLQMMMKAGNLPFTVQKKGQTEEEYAKQVEYWREVGAAVERYTYATTPSRAFSALEYFRQLKPNSSDTPNVAMKGFSHFESEAEDSLKLWVAPYALNPQHKGILSETLQGTGLAFDPAGKLVTEDQARAASSAPKQITKSLHGHNYLYLGNGKWGLLS